MSARTIPLAAGADLDGFRAAVRRLVALDVPPQDVAWTEGASLFDGGDFSPAVPEAAPIGLPRAAAELIERVACHRDPERWALLYGLVWRLRHGERHLVENAADPLVHRLMRLAKAIDREVHKTHAFVRFRRFEGEGGERYVAWFEPDNHVLERAAPFFVERFSALRWSILTPLGSAHWDGEMLAFGPPGRREDAGDADAFEAAWCDYYAAAFNPARVNTRQMRSEMPVRYWRNMPETQAIGGLVRQAPQRVEEMMAQEIKAARKLDPLRAVAAMAEQGPHSLEELNRLIAASEPLVPGATRAVLGEGPIGATIAFVGEQPGDEEDLAGHPFVGPAGQMLDRAMAEAGIDRAGVYVTNAVKHFKFEQRGKKRIHQSPTTGEVKHYRWWLMHELDFVAPKIVVGLGATAVLALAGKAVPVTKARGPAEFGDRQGFITVHPSYLLRLPGAAARAEAYAAFVADLARVRALVG